MNCGMKLIKYLLFMFNIIFIIFAFVLIGVGATAEIKYRPVVQVTEGAISTAPVLLLCIGVFILFLSLLGGLGAYRESYCMIATFAGLMAIMFILEIAAASTAYSLRASIGEYLTSSFKTSVSEYSSKTKNPLNFIQMEFHCCGAINSTDWYQDHNSTFFVEAVANAAEHNITNSDKTYTPDSCCQTVKDFCGLYEGEQINTVGCIEAIEIAFKKNIASVGGVALTIIFIQLFGLGFAYVLMKTIAAQYETV